MALIKCIECNKEISDKAKSCPHCGCPVNINETSTIKNNKPSKYKKFDFNHMQKVIDNPKLISKNKGDMRKGSIVTVIIGMIFFLIANSIDGSSNAGGMFALGCYIFSIAFFYFSIRLFFNSMSKRATKGNIEELIKENYYKEKIEVFSNVPEDLDYKEISFLEANSKDELLNEAFDLNADALINIQVQKYTSSDTKSHFNGIGVQRSIKTDVKEHENWTATAITINSNYYHKAVNLERIL